MSASSTAELLGPLNTVEQKFAPPRLWIAGDRTLLRHHPRVAVVGTRKPSEAGERRTRRLVRELVKHHATVVSGLAEGIDTVAHTEAIAHGGRTIAVLGTPIEEVFPRKNAGLQQRIAREHLVVSEFAPNSPVSRGNFPRRNRTMALLADASVIIEASDGSGTISQGWEALRLGRPLFLLKSLVDSPLTWPSEMIEYGAMILSTPDDLLSMLPSDGFCGAIPF